MKKEKTNVTDPRTGDQATPAKPGTRVDPAAPGTRVMVLTVSDENVPAVLAAAKLINPDEDVAGFLGLAPVEGPISGTGCTTTGGTFHPSDFNCKDSDSNIS